MSGMSPGIDNGILSSQWSGGLEVLSVLSVLSVLISTIRSLSTVRAVSPVGAVSAVGTVGAVGAMRAHRESSDSSVASTTHTLRFQAASCAIANRDNLVAEAAETIEQHLTLLGATAIEDKLQEVTTPTIYMYVSNKCIAGNVHLLCCHTGCTRMHSQLNQG